MRLTPRGGADATEGVSETGELRVRVRAAPVDGAANAALARTIARELRVAPSTVAVVGGATTRTKRVAVEDVDAGRLRARWPGLLTREE